MSLDAFLHSLDRLSTGSTPAARLADFCELTYCAYARFTAPTPQHANALHQRALAVAERSSAATMLAYDALRDLAQQTVRRGGIDLLGDVSTRLKLLDSGRKGQFTTPWNIARFMAEEVLVDLERNVQDKGYVTICDPAVGPGVLMLACADVIQEKGYDPADVMVVNAIDLDRFAYQMGYLQLTWRGIPAFVEQRDALFDKPPFEAAWTPATARFWAKHPSLLTRATLIQDETTFQLSLFPE